MHTVYGHTEKRGAHPAFLYVRAAAKNGVTVSARAAGFEGKKVGVLDLPMNEAIAMAKAILNHYQVIP